MDMEESSLALACAINLATAAGQADGAFIRLGNRLAECSRSIKL
jgi:hypothetical protein